MMSEQKQWSLDEIEAEVFRIIKEEKQLDESFTLTTSLEQVGLDSLALVRILVGVDQSLGVWLEGEALTPENLLDVKHMAAYIHELLQQS
jgi:acyl carrier protein